MSMGLKRFLSAASGADLASESPLFLLGFHRGGTTFVQRAVNCSSEIYVMGEHGGIMRFYRQAFDTFSRIPKRKLKPEAAKAKGRQVNAWSAMENALDADDYLEELRRHVKSLFAVKGMPRWGFKEIHYHSVDDVRFLTTLFPACRIAFLHRDPVEMFLSHYFVHWNTDVRERGAEAAARDFAAEYRATMADFNAAAEQYDNARIFEVAELGKSVDDFAGLAEFAGLSMARFDRASLEETFVTRVGSSFGGVKGKGADASQVEVDAARNAVEAALAASGAQA